MADLDFPEYGELFGKFPVQKTGLPDWFTQGARQNIGPIDAQTGWGTIGPDTRSYADQIPMDISSGMQRAGFPESWSQDFGRKAGTVLDMSPLGAGMAYDRATNDVSAGNYGSAALDGIGALAIFAGPAAKTADLAALDIAKGLASQGATREAIWRKTGWFQGADKNWRFEIPDNKATVTPEARQALGVQTSSGGEAGVFGNAPDLFDHRALYDAYPQLANTELTYVSPRDATPYNAHAMFTTHGSSGGPEISVSSTGFQGDRSFPPLTLHEFQHSVQNIEGWQGGGSPETSEPIYDTDRIKHMLDVYRQAYSKLKDAGVDLTGSVPPQFENAANLTRDLGTHIDQLGRYEGYRRLSGEVEASNAEKRWPMSPAQRAQSPPWYTQDYPEDQQIIPGGPQTLNFKSASEPFKPGITAYHGSPHSFDKFDINKIGTGEGAQSFGRGLYFAGNEATAKSYRDVLSNREWKLPLEHQTPENVAMMKRINDRNSMQENLGDFQKMVGDNANYYSGLANDSLVEGDMERWQERHARATNYSEMADWLKNNGDKIDKGSMYEVNIAADPDHFLDWDKPLYEQTPHVKSALNTIGVETTAKGGAAGFNRGGPGGNAFPHLDVDEGSRKLNEAGIPGIKYLDAGSRAAGEGTRNYVVFDDKLISILRKYGLAGFMAGGAGADYALTNDGQPDTGAPESY